MAESLNIVAGNKEENYICLIPQIEALIDGEENLYANLSNVAAALKMAFDFFWVGFYLVDNDDENQLVLGPFQGPIACTRIQYGKGVCGTAWQEQKTISVPNVDAFPGHIACSSDAKSEIVVPIFKNNKVVAVLDIDSNQLNDFDKLDEIYLISLTKCLEKIF